MPQWINGCVFIMKDNQHWRGGHTPCHSTAVQVLPKLREGGTFVFIELI